MITSSHISSLEKNVGFMYALAVFVCEGVNVEVVSFVFLDCGLPLRCCPDPSDPVGVDGLVPYTRLLLALLLS